MKNKPLQILFLLASLAAPQQVLAAEAALPIRAGIVQCGVRAELQMACSRDERCCGLLHLAPAADMADTDTVETAPEEGIRMSRVTYIEKPAYPRVQR